MSPAYHHHHHHHHHHHLAIADPFTVIIAVSLVISFNFLFFSRMNYYWIVVRINVLTPPKKKIKKKNEKGWSGHPVCRKRYHLIIRAASGSGSLDDGYQDHNKSCSSCGAQLHLSESRYLPVLLSLSQSQYSNSALTLPYCLSIYLVIYRCRSCNCVITADDLEDWAYNQFEDHTHLLHAVVHSNGYAHLLTVNGREGGSLFLSGRHIMDFWDRLSTSLAVRSALLCFPIPYIPIYTIFAIFHQSFKHAVFFHHKQNERLFEPPNWHYS